MNVGKFVRNNKGFTLVEVIVVAVIVLVLAAVAIPLYKGYVDSSKEAALENAAATIAGALGAAVQTGGTVIHPTGAGGTGKVSGPDGGEDPDVDKNFIKIKGAGGGDESRVLVPARMTANIKSDTVEVYYSADTSAQGASNGLKSAVRYSKSNN